MRTPIKLNKAYWPEVFTKYLPSAEDPRFLTENVYDAASFSKAVSVFKFGTTFKTTEKNRYPLTLQYLSHIEFSSPPTIIDIGASDGSTSLDAIEKISFHTYYITDLHLEVFYEMKRKEWLFYDCSNTCILMVTDKWMIYPDTKGAFFPFGHLAEYIYSKLPRNATYTGKIRLINPNLASGKHSENIVIKQYNIFEQWNEEKADLIIAANILNNFSDSDKVKALLNVFDALHNPSKLAIIENKDVEKSTIFHLYDNQIIIENEIHDGTEIKTLVLKVHHEFRNKNTQP